jgi:hypothetical protein
VSTPVRLMRFSGAVRRDPGIDAWMDDRPGDLGAIAREWLEVIRGCGDDVCELLHDGHPTACVGDAAFAYVDAFTAHVNVGFFVGTRLLDPAGLLEGTGRLMRHVTLRPGGPAVHREALEALIRLAHADMRHRVGASTEP